MWLSIQRNLFFLSVGVMLLLSATEYAGWLQGATAFFSWAALLLLWLYSVAVFIIPSFLKLTPQSKYFTHYMLVALFAKFFLSAFLILLYISLAHSTDKWFVVPFFLLYTLYTVFDVYQLIQLSRRASSTSI